MTPARLYLCDTMCSTLPTTRNCCAACLQACWGGRSGCKLRLVFIFTHDIAQQVLKVSRLLCYGSVRLSKSLSAMEVARSAPETVYRRAGWKHILLLAMVCHRCAGYLQACWGVVRGAAGVGLGSKAPQCRCRTCKCSSGGIPIALWGVGFETLNTVACC